MVSLISPEQVVSQLVLFFSSLLSNAFAGDTTSIAFLALLVLVLFAVFFKVSQIVFGLVKRFFLFLIVLLSIYIFVVNFHDKIFSANPDFVIIGIGIVGLLVGLIAFVISVYSMHSSYYSFKSDSVKEEAGQKLQEQKQQKPIVVPKVMPSQLQQSDFFSQQVLLAKSFNESIQDDRSILAVLSYSIIAQFGVFSGVTVSAPSIEVGIAFFVAFFVGAFIFIKTSYHNYVKGLTHLVFAAGFGIFLSVVLGHFWGTIPLSELLSFNYFKSHALVALVTGIAVSLLLGSKH